MIDSPEDFERMASTYFDKCEADGSPVTMTGLALAVGLNSRQTLLEYGKREGFSGPVKQAKLRVEGAYERRLYEASCTGAIFALKNMGWSDRQEIEHSGKVKLESLVLDSMRHGEEADAADR